MIGEALKRRLEKLERQTGDNYQQAMADAHHDVKLAMLLQLRVLMAERAYGQPTGEAVLDKNTRAMLAEKIRDEDARYRSMPREEYLATLPKSYRCGKCGVPVAIDVEKMLRLASALPTCSCIAGEEQQKRGGPLLATCVPAS